MTSSMVFEVTRLRLQVKTYTRENEHQGGYIIKERSGQHKGG